MVGAEGSLRITGKEWNFFFKVGGGDGCGRGTECLTG